MSLKIGYNPLDSKQLENVIHGLSRSSLVSLDIRNLSLAGQLPSKTFILLSLTPIKYLKMANNKINKIPEGAFANLPNLLLIDMSACRIQIISEQAFENLTQLQTLFLNDNNLVKLPQGLPQSLTKLYLNGNQIESITNSDLSHLNILQELYIEKNSIHELHEEAFLDLKQLKKLHLSFNHISTLPGKLFLYSTNLISLELSNNNIKVIPKTDGRFSSLRSLTYLNMNSNNLVQMPLDVLDPLLSLQYLFLENNKLGPLIAGDYRGELFKNLGKLKKLFLSNNELQVLPQNMLANLKALQTLNMSANRISHWENNFFFTTQSLLTLDLSKNWISLFNESSVTNLRSIQSLNLSKNPFACNCDAVWFCNWVNDTIVVVDRKDSFTCNSPSAWQGKLMRTFCEAHIDCRDYTLYYIIGATAAGFFITLIMGSIMYRYRWFIRYRAYRVRRGMGSVVRANQGYQRLPGEDKLFDIYISYAEKDWQWVTDNIVHKLDAGEFLGIRNEGCYRICFKARDFYPERMEVASIAENISASRHVIIIATEEYAKCALCEFEFDLIMSMKIQRNNPMQKNNSVFHLIKVGVLPHKIPKMMENLIESHEYTEWVDPQCAEHAFLEILKDKIGDAIDTQNAPRVAIQ